MEYACDTGFFSEVILSEDEICLVIWKKLFVLSSFVHYTLTCDWCYYSFEFWPNSMQIFPPLQPVLQHPWTYCVYAPCMWAAFAEASWGKAPLAEVQNLQSYTVSQKPITIGGVRFQSMGGLKKFLRTRMPKSGKLQALEAESCDCRRQEASYD